MDIESLNAMNKDMSCSLLMTLEIMLVALTLLALAAFVIYLASVAWFCFKEKQQPARHRMKPAPKLPEPDEYDPLVVRAVLDDGLGDNLTGGVSRREPALTSSM